MNLPLILWLTALFLMIIAPFVIVQFMKSKRSVFIMTFLITASIAYLTRYSGNFHEGHFSSADKEMALCMIWSLYLGVAVRSIVLFRRLKKAPNQKITWSRKDAFSVMAILCCLFTWEIINTQHICITELQSFNKEEVLDRYLKKHPQKGYYNLTEDPRPFLSPYQWILTLIIIRDENSAIDSYAYDSSLKLDTCGRQVSSPLSMTISKKDALEKISRYSKYYRKIEFDKK